MTYALTALVFFALGYGAFAAIHRAAIAKVRSELARIQPIVQKALEGQADFKRAHDDLLRRKWGTKSGIISL